MNGLFQNIPDNVFPNQKVLSLGIQFGIVAAVVVSLGQELRFRSATCQPNISSSIEQRKILPDAKLPNNSMNDGNILPLYCVDGNIPNGGFGPDVSVPED